MKEVAATVWKGHLSFGLISIPVRLLRAARTERIPLRQLARVESPAESPAAKQPPAGGGKVVEMPVAPVPEGPSVERVHHAPITESAQEPIPPTEVIKGYEYGSDQWVLLEKEDLQQIAPKTSRVIDIREFVRFSEIDPLYLENSYYVAPEKSGEKAYALLYQALRDTGFAALGDIAMHKREHVLIVRPGGSGLIGHTMFYDDEVRREDEPRADLSLVTPKELELAKVFVQTLAGTFDPEKYKDAYRERLRQLIEAKAKGRELATAAAEAPAQQKTLDLMEALQQSLALARKPPEAEQPPAKGKKRRSGPTASG